MTNVCRSHTLSDRESESEPYKKHDTQKEERPLFTILSVIFSLKNCSIAACPLTLSTAAPEKKEIYTAESQYDKHSRMKNKAG